MQADATKLADPIDQKRFTFRYAKVQAALKTGDAKSIHTALTAPPTGEEVEGIRRRLLAENCLRLSPPDTRLAKDELKTYLTSSLKLPAATVARYQQRLADLHMTLNEPKEARAWLKDIGAGAAPDVQALAKLQLGLNHVILQDPAVKSLSSFIGIDGTNTTVNSGRIQINLKPLEERRISATEVIRRLQPRLSEISNEVASRPTL